MTDQGYRHFHRIVKTNPSRLDDFLSNAEKGNPPPDDPALRAVWDGLSVYSTLGQARRKRRTSPAIGDFIAVLRVPTDGSVRFARTLSGDGHHTIWGDPAVLRALIVSIEPIG